MDFPASLDYLYGLQRFGIKLGLENMQALKSALPILQEPVPCVHIAGTNGKGSVSAMLAEILKHSGLRVGLYTSPHLHCFTERIRIDGVPITRNEAANLAEAVRLVTEDIPVTFFEATTTMAMLAFKERRVDIAVYETGLGGRLDATNIVDPLLCLITPISFDHSEHLGPSLSQIATEKAGIIKPHVPVVVGRQDSEVAGVILASATSRDVQVSLAGRDFFWRGNHDDLAVDVGNHHFGGLSCVLPGEHQLDNFAQAITAAVQLREQGVKITSSAIRKAGRTVHWPGRLEWFGGSRQVLLDVSHNRAGVDCLAGYLKEQNVSRIHLVVGLSGERAPSEILMPLVKFVSALYAVPVSCGQSVPTKQIAAWAKSEALPVSEYPVATDGLADALERSCNNEPVVVCGSLYLVAELRQRLLEGDCSNECEMVDSL